MKRLFLLILISVCSISLSACEFRLIPENITSEEETVEEMEEEKIEEKEEIEDIQEHEALIPDTEPYNPSDQQTTGKIFVPSPDNVRPKDAIPPKEATISGEAQFSSQSLFSVRNQRK